MITPERMAWFDQYLNNELDASGRKSFDKTLQADPEFENDYKLYLKTVEVIKVLGLRKDIREVMIQQARPVVFLKQKITWMAVAASLTLALAILLWNRKVEPDVTALFQSYYQPYPNILASRGIVMLNPALNDYSLGNFSEALKKLDASVKTDTTLFYQGLCYLSLNEADNALVAFKGINENSIFSQHVRWYNALAFLLKDDTKSVARLLREIMPGEFKKKESEELLKLIRED